MAKITELEILHPHEIGTVLAWLTKKKRLKTYFQRLIIFRLAACCGLRRKEIQNLELRDVVLTGDYPAIHVRPAATKASRQDGKRRGRFVPLYWDEGTRRDIEEWMNFRQSDVFPETDLSQPVVCCVVNGRLGSTIGGRLAVSTLSQRWQEIIKPLGPDRVRQTTLHSGRHTWISNALHAGRSLVEVARAAGHASLDTTSHYAHLIERDGVPDIFDMVRIGPKESTSEHTHTHTGRRYSGGYQTLGRSDDGMDKS